MSNIQKVKLRQFDNPLESATHDVFTLDSNFDGVEDGEMFALLLAGAEIEGVYSPARDGCCEVCANESFYTNDGWHFHLDDIETEVVKS